MRTLAVLAIAALGCQPHATTPPSTAPSREPVTAAPPTEGPRRGVHGAPYSGPLLAGGPALVRLDDRGATIETLTVGEVHEPRWLVPGESVLFLRQDGPRWQLVRFELASRAETVVAGDLVGDAVRCPGEGPSELSQELSTWLDVQSDWDFRVGDGVACIGLMDRNENMAEARLEVTVSLADGRVSRALEFAFFCEDEGDDEDDDAASEPSPDAAERDPCRDAVLHVGVPADPAPTSAAPFRVEAGRVLRRVGDRDEVVAGPYACVDDEGRPTKDGCPWGLPTFAEGSRSPSGRWVVLRGNHSEGDYMHEEWLLLDATTGDLFAVADGEGTGWPPPLTAAQLGALAFGVANNDVVGESVMLWLSDDRLVVDQRLVLPGEAVIQLPGPLAR